MADLLLELFSEEVPARMQVGAAAQLEKALTDKLAEARLECKSIKTFSTPRRLAIVVGGLPAVSPDISVEKKGPKVGAAEAALQGFLKSTGLKLEQLEKRNTGKEECYFAVIHQKGEPAETALKRIIEEILKGFAWPKSMRWGSADTTWVRPLQNILCLFDNKIVPVEFAGLKANDKTFGHRFLAPAAITIKNSADYEALLEKANVIADREKRKAKINTAALELAKAKSLALKEDNGLLEEVAGLVEWPVALMGGFDAKYLTIPPEVPTTVMKQHQRYFSLLCHSRESGNLVQQEIPASAGMTLSNNFIVIANMQASDGGKAIIAGNERVLKARLDDGIFHWEQDKKKPLSDWAKGLQYVIFHAKIGSVAEKVTRITKLADALCAFIPGADKAKVKRAAELCKADLVTGMVGEFAELQGLMGRYYALEQKEAAEVADAIRDHYLPLGPDSPCPTAPTSIAVSLADKIDTLVSMFAIGEKPTGSKDPFALRRAALGIIRIVVENNIRLPLKPCFAAVPAVDIALHKAQKKLVEKTESKLQNPDKVGKYLTVNETAHEELESVVPSNLADMLYDFFIDRLKVQLKDQGIRHDVISAVTASGDDDLVRIVARARALQDFLATDNGANLLAAYKRAANIVRIEEKKDGKAYSGKPSEGVAAEEKALFTALASAAPKVEKAAATEKYTEVMDSLATLRAPVDAFFDKVTVNDTDKNLRENRLLILAEIRRIMNSVADFAAIEG